MGFCRSANNTAVAAAHARNLGAARVAMVDFDVDMGMSHSISSSTNAAERPVRFRPQSLFLNRGQLEGV